MKKHDLIFVIIILIVLGAMLYKMFIFKDTVEGKALVYEISEGHRTSTFLEYCYYFENSVFYGSKRVRSYNAKKFIGKYYSVRISLANPSNSILELDKKIYNEYNPKFSCHKFE